LSNDVLTAVSGGLDSTYALLKLREDGYNVHAVHFILNPYQKHDSATRRSLQIFCDKNFINLIVQDHRVQFQQTVIDAFVQNYSLGLTPNPCVECNRFIKWDLLHKEADQRGIEKIATGHYAKIIQKKNGRFTLLRQKNLWKDQTYMLWRLRQSDLERTIFPLAEIQKSDVQTLLAQSAPDFLQPKESQDICFIPDGDYVAFLKEKASLGENPGPIQNKEGLQIGTHSGFWKYTIGQRRGLGIAYRVPLYVIEIDPSRNAVIVGEQSDLETQSFRIKNINFLSISGLTSPGKFSIKTRYRQGDIIAEVIPLSSNEAEVHPQETILGVAPGQSLVAYDGDELAFGGIIDYPLNDTK